MEKEYLIFTRSALGFTQSEIADLTGYSRNYIALIENGYRGVSKRYAEAFDAAMNLTAEEKVMMQSLYQKSKQLKGVM